jgi:nucleotide-binding universal stress UspA family protein
VEITRPTGRVGEQILGEAARISAGLLVMGALGQGAVRELLLGSVTRHVLQKLSLPVLLDH